MTVSMQRSVIYYLRTESQHLGQSSFVPFNTKQFIVSATDFRNLLIISDTMNCNCADKLLQIRKIRKTTYCSPPNIYPPFCMLFSVYSGRDYYSNVSNYTPHKHINAMRWKKVQLDFAVAIENRRTAEMLIMYHVNFPSLLVIPTEKWQQDNSLHHWWQERSGRFGGSDVCLCL